MRLPSPLALTCLTCLLIASISTHAAVIDPAPFLKADDFNDIKISPNGDYLAATLLFEDRTNLVVLKTSDLSVTANIGLGSSKHVDEFWWVNPERVMISIAERFGQRDLPRPTGELSAINADGTRAELLVGYRVAGAALGSRVSSKKGDKVAAQLVDDLANSDRNSIIATQQSADDPFRKVEQMDVYSGRRLTLGSAPVRNAVFSTDNAGVVRLVRGYNQDRAEHLYHRKDNDSEWVEITAAEPAIGEETPVGFSADNRLAYVLSRQAEGPDALVEINTETMERRVVLRDKVSDPVHIIYRNASRIPIGAAFDGERRHTQFFDDAAPEAKLYRALEAAFAPQAVEIASWTTDGGKALVRVWSDRSPGDYYAFDTATKEAKHLLISRKWLDPEEMGATTAFSLKARDGLDLRGFVTRPKAKAEGPMPMVVMPHGGPFGVHDAWGFDPEVQMLAASGYSVLQVNFRGSGNYGKQFQVAGAKQWGRTMQDDLTDATRWAIETGIADPNRICIHGASYGGYAALMGAAREPDLYRCASGYVGVYDLPTMHSRGDIQGYGSGETYLREWVGEEDSLAQVSPNKLAERIKVPVLLAAGGQDQRAPIEHTKSMEAALKRAGGSVQSLYYEDEGHGFYIEKNRQAYYTLLLEFLHQHIGQAAAEAEAEAP